MSLCIINDITTNELFSKTGQCSTTITKLLAELERTVPSAIIIHGLKDAA